MNHDNVDLKEIHQFAHIANTWWDLEGPMKLLHGLNPLRLSYIQENLTLDSQSLILDVGCGGGILSEGLAKLGAQVTGIDLCTEVLLCAKEHANQQQLAVHYQHISTAEMAKQYPEYFDAIVCMEMLEHVPDPGEIVAQCAALVKPGGKVFFSTINRTISAFLGGIVAAEYILGLLPQGTHHYSHFIQPAELNRWGRQAQLCLERIQGIGYQLLTGKFYYTSNVNTNYLAHFTKSSSSQRKSPRVAS